MTASVVICTRRQPPSLRSALQAVRQQTLVPSRVVVVRSGFGEHSALPPWLRAELDATGATVVDMPALGVARARQAGLEHAGSEVVAFLDDDALPAETGWLGALCADFDRDEVGATGGTILPRWPGGRPPRWVHPVLATYFGERRAGPANPHLPFGANMAVRRAAALAAGGFLHGLGHQGRVPGLHEETELCRRLRARGLEVIDVPDAVVFHEVRPEQLSVRWALRRAWAEGRSDAARDQLEGGRTIALHAVKLAGLTIALPLALRPRWRAVIPARALVNAGYLSAPRRSPR